MSSSPENPSIRAAAATPTAAVAGSQAAAARQGLKNRGISNPDELLQQCDPDTVLRVCAAWDARPDAGPGVLALMIREAEPAASTAPQEICPCTGELADEWRAALQPLLDSDDEQMVMRVKPWLQTLHAHAHDAAGWTFGVEGWALTYWNEKGRGRTLRKALGEPLKLVVCNGLNRKVEAEGQSSGASAVSVAHPTRTAAAQETSSR